MKTETETGSVTGDIHNIQNRLENVKRRTESSQRTKLANKELIWKFVEHCRLQGLSTLRVDPTKTTVHCTVQCTLDFCLLERRQ